MKNMEKMLKQLSLLLVLAYLHIKAGNSELTAFPRDTEVLVNHSTYFNCSTSIRSEQIHWYHYRVGENKTNYVYYKGQFNQIYADRYSIKINIETGEYNLIIRSVQPGDAGRYVCEDDGGLGNFSSAELIVLDSTPTCQSSMKPEGLVGPNSCGLPIDELRLSCSTSYSGNIPSTLQWKMEGDDTPILKEIASDHSGKRVTMNLTMSSELEMDGALFTCSNTKSHDKQYSCTTGPVKIDYAVDQHTILNLTKSETITCSAITTVPCAYRWFYGNDTLCPPSCNQVLTTTRLGAHSCEASCTINGISCTFVAIRIFVFENEASTASEDTTKTLLLAILIPTVAILLIIACVLIVIIRKAVVAKKVLRPTCNDENAVLHKTIRQSRAADEVNNDEVYSVRNDNPSADSEVELHHLLKGDANIIQSCIEEDEIMTRASKDMGRAIVGVAVLENLIYLVSDRSSEVEMFDVRTFQFKHRCNLKKLKNPWDMAGCKLNKCLYIMDLSSATKPKYVIRVDSKVRASLKWSTGEQYETLSVSNDGKYVVVTVCDKNRLLIYEPNGMKLNVISLSEDMIHPSHALKMKSGLILISHVLKKDNIHRVSILSAKGEIMQSSCERMETPSYLALGGNGSVFVADQGNSRVCVLNSDLELIGEVASKRNGLQRPQRLFFNGESGKLFVADNEVQNKGFRYGKLLNFNYDL